MAQTRPAPGQLDNQLNRRGPLFAAIWLFFLLEPLRDGWTHRDTVAGVLGIVVTHRLRGRLHAVVAAACAATGTSWSRGHRCAPRSAWFARPGLRSAC